MDKPKISGKELQTSRSGKQFYILTPTEMFDAEAEIQLYPKVTEGKGLAGFYFRTFAVIDGKNYVVQGWALPPSR